MTRAAKQQAGRVPLVCDTVNMFFSLSFRILQYYIWLGDRFGTARSTASTSGRPTSQKKSMSPDDDTCGWSVVGLF